jgi:hypothetical protein
MTVRRIERLMVRMLWAVCLVVIVRWVVVHKLDEESRRGSEPRARESAQRMGRS